MGYNYTIYNDEYHKQSDCTSPFEHKRIIRRVQALCIGEFYFVRLRFAAREGVLGDSLC